MSQPSGGHLPHPYGTHNNPGYGPPPGSPDTARVNAVVDTTDAVDLDNSRQSPPNYMQLASPTALEGPAIPAVKPVNFVSLMRESISGIFVIDPMMKVPSWLLQQVQYNMCLTSSHGVTPNVGTLDVVIHLVHGGEQVQRASQKSSPRRTWLYARSNDSAKATLVCVLLLHLHAYVHASDQYI